MTDYSMIVAQALCDNMELTALRGDGYIQVTLPQQSTTLCFIRPIEEGVRVEFKLTPNKSATALTTKTREIELLFNRYGTLCLKEGRRSTMHSIENNPNETVDLVTLAFYRHNLLPSACHVMAK